MDVNFLRSSIHEGELVATSIVGTGAANPTKSYGQLVTVTRTATGIYRYKFGEGLGTFIAAVVQLGATTQSDLKGFSFVRGAYDTTNKQIDIAIFNASVAAADLQALQYMDVLFLFAATGSP